MKYQVLVDLYESLGATAKRLQKIQLIGDFLKTAPEGVLEESILLMQGRVFPSWDERKIGMAAKLVVKALQTATGADKSAVEWMWKKTGDLGDAAEQLIEKKKQATLVTRELDVKRLFSNIQKLAALEGEGTVAAKVQLVAELLTSATPKEAKYVIRTILEELRVGVGEGNLRDALVWAFFGKELGLSYDREEHAVAMDNKEKYQEVLGAIQQAYDLTNDFSLVVNKARSGGLAALKSLGIRIFTPLKVMLALKVDSIEEGFERCGKPCAVEFKLDGFRIQIHKEGKGIKLFTRRLEEVTAQFPDVVDYVRDHVRGKSFILDSEAAGFDKKSKKYLPFQSIGQRIRRKYDIEQTAKDFPVEVNLFDILYFEGRTLLHTPFAERRRLLASLVDNIPRKMVVVRQLVTEKEKEAEKFYKESLKAGNEGVMFKTLDAPYKPGARVGHMVKMKPVMETLDLVIVGAEWGEGKRAQWLSSFTLACIDGQGTFREIGKMGTGIKEKEDLSEKGDDAEGEGVTFEQLTNELKPLIIGKGGKEVTVRPKIVVEVHYEEIQKSPTYSSGFALRFPRLVRLRADRAPEECSTLEMVEQLFAGQKKGKSIAEKEK
ncbi:ATP-dependent DNA ligase [Candidatus Woesearchaeota archaeon]|nr:ATP-dependent DNA ligase [Candidatus Woesearchaeota archaeon]